MKNFLFTHTHTHTHTHTGFTQFMLGSEMDVFNQSHGSVYQDMTQPLSHYYIASSHNT